MSQRVETNMNKQETIALTLTERIILKKILDEQTIPWRLSSDQDLKTISTGGAEMGHNNQFQNLPPFLPVIT